jgi:hypothetical protein
MDVAVSSFPGENTALCIDDAKGSDYLSNHTRSPSFGLRPAASARQVRNCFAKWRIRHLTPALSPIEAEREGVHTTALPFELRLRRTFVGEGWLAQGLGSVFDDARPGAFDAAEVAGEFGPNKQRRQQGSPRVCRPGQMRDWNLRAAN